MLIKPALRQIRSICRFDVDPLVTQPSSIFRGFDAFKFDQHSLCMGTRVGKRHWLVLIADEKFSPTLKTLGKVRMQIHNDFPAQAMRTTQETHYQIDRLA